MGLKRGLNGWVLKGFKGGFERGLDGIYRRFKGGLKGVLKGA